MNPIEIKQIQNLFKKFLEDFNVERSRRIWLYQNKDFHKFWEGQMMDNKAKISNDELIKIIQIFDVNASRGGKDKRFYEEGVCRAIIFQNVWQQVFAELQDNKQLRELLDAIFLSGNSDIRIEAINRLKSANQNKNGLTGKKAVMLNCMLVAYDAFTNLSVASLGHRYQLIEAFGISPIKYKSYGEEIVKTNTLILEKFQEVLGGNYDARTISRFIYTDLMRALWQKDLIASAEEPEETPEEGGTDQNFALEQHLEEFLIANWAKLPFCRPFDLILNDDGQPMSRQYACGTVGRIDLLVREKQSKDYVVMELKKNRATDVVVGQILKYIGWIKKNLAKEEKVGVRGIIIVPQDSEDLMYALSGQKDIEAYTYAIAFSVQKCATI